MAILLLKVKKSAKMFCSSEKNTYLRAMEQTKQYVVTAVNRLSGVREEISGPMSEDQARQRLEREIANRSRQRYQPYTRLRVDRRLPVQLTLQFNEV